VERLKIHSPLEKDRKRWMWEENQMELRMRYGVACHHGRPVIGI
jgi:hypothetical protein